MKKLLSILGALALSASATSSVIACGSKENTPPSPAQAIINKIKNKSFSVPWNTNPDTTNTATITAIKSALKKANSSITDDDLTKLTFSSAGLDNGSTSNIKVTSTVKKDVAYATLSITMDDDTAQQISSKITNKALVYYKQGYHQKGDVVTYNTNNLGVRNDIIDSLKRNNPLLSNSDLQKIVIPKNITITTASSTNINLTVNKNKATVQVTGVTVAVEPSADRFVKDIAVNDIAIANNNSKDPTQTTNKDNILDALKASNAGLDADAPTTSVFTIKSLSGEAAPNLQVDVKVSYKIIFTVDGESASKDIKVLMAPVIADLAAKFNGYTTKKIAVPFDTDPDLSWPTTPGAKPTAAQIATHNAVKQAIKNTAPDGTTITDYDLTTLETFTLGAGSDIPLASAGDTSLAFDIVIPGQTTVNVTGFSIDIASPSSGEILSAITDKNITVPLNTNPAVSNAATKTAIQDAVATGNPRIKEYKTSLTFDKPDQDSVVLASGRPVLVQIGCKYGSSPQAKGIVNLLVTLGSK